MLEPVPFYYTVEASAITCYIAVVFMTTKKHIDIWIFPNGGHARGL